MTQFHLARLSLPHYENLEPALGDNKRKPYCLSPQLSDSLSTELGIHVTISSLPSLLREVLSSSLVKVPISPAVVPTRMKLTTGAEVLAILPKN